MGMEALSYCKALHSVAAAINSTLDPDAVLQAVVQKSAEAMNVKGCSMMLIDRGTGELRHAVHHGLSSRYVRKGPVRLDPHISSCLEGRSVAVLDAASDPRVQYQEEAKAEGIASMLSVPIRLRGEVVGVMRVYTDEPMEFDEDDIEFVEAVANLGAIGLDNAYRYREATVDLESLRSYVMRYGGS